MRDTPRIGLLVRLVSEAILFFAKRESDDFVLF